MDSCSEETSLPPIHHGIYSALEDITVTTSFRWGRKKNQIEWERGNLLHELGKSEIKTLQTSEDLATWTRAERTKLFKIAL